MPSTTLFLGILAIVLWINIGKSFQLEHLCDYDSNHHYKFQAVTRDNHRLLLIESDNLYEIPIVNLRALKRRINVWNYVTKSPLDCHKWYQIDWLIKNVVDRAKFAKDKRLLYFEMFNEPFFAVFKLKDWFVGDDSAILHYFFIKPKHNNQFSLNQSKTLKLPATDLDELVNWQHDPFNVRTIVDGITFRKGYLVEMDLESKRIVFSNLADAIHVHFQREGNKERTFAHYHLQLSEARDKVFFIEVGENSDPKDDLIIEKIPFGFIDKGDLYLFDALTKLVYRLPFVQLSDNSATINDQPVTVDKIPMEDFFFCKDKSGKDSDKDSSSLLKQTGIEITCIVAGILVMLAMVGVTAVMANNRCRRSSNRNQIGHSKLRAMIPYLKPVRYKTDNLRTSDHSRPMVTFTKTHTPTNTHTPTKTHTPTHKTSTDRVAKTQRTPTRKGLLRKT